MLLMSIVIGKFTDKDHRSIHRVRSHLSVVHVNDVCYDNGRNMDVEFFANTYTVKYRNTYNWPEKYHVIKVDYTAWRKLLKCIFRCKNYTLPVTLGSWIQILTVDWVGNWNYFITQDR